MGNEQQNKPGPVPTAPSSQDAVEDTEVVVPEAPQIPVETPSEPAASENPHVYHDVADGVKGRVSTEAERQARNTLAAAQEAAQG